MTKNAKMENAITRSSRALFSRTVQPAAMTIKDDMLVGAPPVGA
jgi:hypothetical protein